MAYAPNWSVIYNRKFTILKLLYLRPQGEGGSVANILTITAEKSFMVHAQKANLIKSFFLMKINNVGMVITGLDQ